MITPSSTSTFYARITAPRNQDDLSEFDRNAAHTYRIVCAILDSRDGISVSGYPSVVLHRDHARFLDTLPEFSRVAYIENARDFYTGDIQFRLWLLSDWLDAESQRRKREQIYADASREWFETRYRFWRVGCWLKFDLKVGREVINTLLDNHYRNWRAKDAATIKMLTLMGFDRPVGHGEVESFQLRVPPELGHLYNTPVDFHGMDFRDLKEYDSQTT